MAITARLGVDFGPFFDAVQKANITLKGFEDGAGAVSKKLDAMANSFSGQKVFQQATLAQKAIADIGGASQLTAKEQQRLNGILDEALQKYTAIGVKAPKGMQELYDATKKVSTATEGWGKQVTSLMGALGIGLSVGGVVAFAKNLLEMGDNLVRVADRTGLTTVEVQKLQFIAGQSGNTIDELTGAIGKLQKNLTLGDSGAVAAVKQLGLNLKQLKNESPYQQMADIATAIEKIPDPAQRATLAIQLFGKGGAIILPTLVAQFQALGDAAPVMSDKTVRALDTAGDALNKFGLQVKVWAAEVYNLAGNVFDRLTSFAIKTAASVLGAVTTFLEIEQKIPGVTAVFNKLGISTQGLRQYQTELNDQSKLLVSHLGDQEVAVRKNVSAFGDFEPKVKKATKAIKDHKYEVVGLGAAEKFMADVLQRLADANAHYYERLEQIIPATRDWWTLLGPVNGEIDVLASHNLPAATGAVANLGSGVVHLGDQLNQASEQAKGFGESLMDSLGSLPSILSKAFEGGGNIAGAFKSFGVQLGNELAKGLSAGMQKTVAAGEAGAGALGGAVGGSTGATIATLASGIGGAAVAASAFGASMAAAGVAGTVALGAVTLGIGAAAVGIYLLAKHWLKVSEAEKAARKTFEEYSKALGVSNVDEFIAKVGAEYAAMGKDGTEAQHDIQAALDATHVSAQAEAQALQVINDKLAAGAIQAAAISSGVSDLVAAGQGLAGGLTANMRDAIEAMLTMKGVTDDERAALQGLLNNSAADFDKLDSIAKKYGDNLEGLGAKFAQGDLNNQATKLYDDFQQLVNGGADVGGTLDLMKDKWKDFAQEALKTGSTVPETLRPILQSLADAGDLTEENGDKLTDLSKFKFADTPLATGIDTLSKAIDHLSDVLGGVPGQFEKIGKAVNDLPPSPYQNFDPTASDTYGSSGGMVTASGIQHFAGGGRVLPFRGSDTVPAMLTPGEMVLTKAQQKAAFSSGGTINIVVQSLLDGRVIAESTTSHQNRQDRLRRKVRAA